MPVPCARGLRFEPAGPGRRRIFQDKVKIFASTKYRGVELLFTESVEKYARADGGNYDYAIREVGWDLISAVGNSASATPGLQAILFNRINYKEKHSFVALGIIAK